MTDIFVALGYGGFRLNVHKSGREIDIQGVHRTEPRSVIAECKATAKPVGGDAINKFVGTLDVERRKRPDNSLLGYYISLTGFTETAREQESDAGGGRVILLNSHDIVRELIVGRIIVPLAEAAARAGLIAAQDTPSLRFTSPATLLASESGWIWALPYRTSNDRLTYILIHADGGPVPESVYQQLRRSACKQACMLRDGEVLSDRLLTPPTARDDVRRRYFDYLRQECGEIQLQGLPADQEVGARRLELEALFVPLHLTPIENKSEVSTRVPVGSVLHEHSRLAILANPGAGKTTLLRRLAVAYAFPERRSESTDNLPDRNWLPLLIRCRQIANPLAPIEQTLREIPARAEFSDDTDVFAHLLREALQLGTALLLIDGLDEIADESHRLAFVEQLRTFLARYPAAAVIITSREAGFRIVGGRLADLCRHYRLSDFDSDDIRRLTIAWHVEVVGDLESVRAEAAALAEIISRLDRVRRLAENPLLLTTLLLVKRWVGQLPTKRAALYSKAIEVLLMTWNVEAHRPLDPEEIVPQLAFVAHSMMESGIQQISQRQLYRLLLLARKQMPEVLGFARLSSAEVVRSVEFRSSLLIQAGHILEDGELIPVYEFRHLTFQEYLAARALADGYYVDRSDSDTLLTKLESHLDDETWAEVIPLTAVVSGRRCEPVVKALVSLVKMKKQLVLESRPRAGEILVRCLCDEVQLSPETLDDAFLSIIRATHLFGSELSELLDSRYGQRFRELILLAHNESSDFLINVGSAVAELALHDEIALSPHRLTGRVVQTAISLLKSDDPNNVSRGCLTIMEVAYQIATRKSENEEEIRTALLSTLDLVVSALRSRDLKVRLASSWATAWLGECGVLDEQYVLSCGSDLLANMTIEHDDLTYVATWAFAKLPPVPPERFREAIPYNDKTREFVTHHTSSELSAPTDRFRIRALAMLSLYYGTPWTLDEAAERLMAVLDSDPGLHARDQITSLLKRFGDAGIRQLRNRRGKAVAEGAS